MTKEQDDFLSHIRKHPGLTYEEIHQDIGEQLDLVRSETQAALSKLLQKGLVEERYSFYSGHILVAK